MILAPFFQLAGQGLTAATAAFEARIGAQQNFGQAQIAAQTDLKRAEIAALTAVENNKQMLIIGGLVIVGILAFKKIK